MKQSILSFTLLLSLTIYAQYNTFHIGMGVMDFNNIKNGVDANNDPKIGCDERYLKVLQEEGFDLILPYHQLMKNPAQWVNTQPSKAFLDRAEKLGLKVILNCPEITLSNRDSVVNYTTENIHSALQYYGDHPAVLGFQIIDEPNIKEHLVAVSHISKVMKQTLPASTRFVNFFPGYATDHQLSEGIITANDTYTWAEYEKYISDFLTQTEVNFLSIDNYAFARSSNYFKNMDFMAQQAQSHQLPYFSMIYIRGQHGKVMGKSIEQFRFAIFTNLIYGSKGLFYYSREGAYCCRDKNCDSCDIIAVNNWDSNVKDTVKQELKTIHQQLLTHADLLYNLQIMNVYHYSNSNGFLEDITENIPTASQWDQLEKNPIFQEYFKSASKIQSTNHSGLKDLAISFLTHPNGEKYMWVFNKNIHENLAINIKLKKKTQLTEVLTDRDLGTTKKISISLQKGEAKLYQLQ